MKKTSLLILLSLVMISQVIAISTTIKQEYRSGETLIAEISGNFLDNLKPENIQFYSGRVFVPLVSGVGKIQDKFYIYALLPNQERNYTLLIKNARYLDAGKEKQEDLSFNFSVKGNSSLFSVNPGFIVTNRDFSIKIESPSSIIITSEFLGMKQETEVQAGKTKTLFYQVPETSASAKLVLSSENMKYEIPVAIFLPAENITSLSSRKLEFSKPSLNLTLLKDFSLQFQVFIRNSGKEAIENISLQVIGDKAGNIINISPEKIEKLDVNDIEEITLTLKPEDEGFSNATLLAISGNDTSEIFIEMLTIKDREIFKNTINISDYSEGSCSDLQGGICNEEETCSTAERFTIEGLCCTGVCEKSSSSWKIILAVLILLVILIIGFFVYKKAKSKNKSSEQLLQEKSKDYEDRFKLKEVKGDLART